MDQTFNALGTATRQFLSPGVSESSAKTRAGDASALAALESAYLGYGSCRYTDAKKKCVGILKKGLVGNARC